MHISFDTSPLYDDNKNRGVGKYTKKLLEGLMKRDDLHVHEFKHGDKVPASDLIHYPYFDPFYLTLPFNKKYPVVVTVHDLIPMVFPDKLPRGIKGELKWQIQKQSLKGAEAVITDSFCSKKDIEKFTGIEKEKIHVVYLAPLLSDIRITEEFKKGIKEKFKLPEKFLLYVGDVNFNKNLLNLYRAVGLIENCPPLVLVGGAHINNDLPEKRELDKLASELKIEKIIIKTGVLTDEGIAAFYQLAFAYLHPSLYEGFGLPVVEAMNLGCPVISSTAGSLAEIIDNGALLIRDPLDPKSIAELISQLLNATETDYRSLVEKGKENAAKYSWEKTVEETIEVYREVVGLG